MLTGKGTATTDFQTVASLLAAGGLSAYVNGATTEQEGYLKNTDTAIGMYVGTGVSSPSSYVTLVPVDSLIIAEGTNLNEVWVRSVSSTVVFNFGEGAIYQNSSINGVVGDITATENQVPKANADGDLVASTISDDGSIVSIAADVSATGTVTSDDATTPAFIIASGNTNTGYIDVFGKTSGKIRITTADATAQTINITAAAQTSGAGTITIPDLAGASTGPVFTGLAQSITGQKTMTSPILVTPQLGTPASGVLTSCTVATATTGDSDTSIASTAFVQQEINANLLTSCLATTVTYNNTAALADTALSVTVATGGIYAVELVVHSTNAVKALNLDFGGTVTPANFIGTWTSLALDADTWQAMVRVSAIGTDYGPASLDAEPDGADYYFTGSLEVTTGGTFLLRGAQNVADASNSTILRGSTLILTRTN